MTPNGTALEHITGQVVSVNPRDIRLNGQADWLNFSKFATDLAPSIKGQAVTATLGRQGFIRTIETTGGPQKSASSGPGPRTIGTEPSPVSPSSRRLPSSRRPCPSSRAARS